MPRTTVLVLTALAVLAGACRSSNGDAASSPSVVATTEAATTSTSTPTTVRATSSTVPRTTVTTVVTLGPGDASIGGTVSGPAGPVDGATVRVERLVGKTVATADVLTSGGGSWQLPSVLGGAYRVRAFKAPDLAQSQVEAFFLGANDRRTIDFKLAGAAGDRITAAVNPNPPRQDQPATVTITVGVGRVDEQGRPAITPRPGVLLTLTPGAGFVLESSPSAVTDGSGAASFAIRCVAQGASALQLTVGTGVTAVTLPACGAPAAPATTRPA